MKRNRAAVVVLGDIGRSTRMQYHALSLAHQSGNPSGPVMPSNFSLPSRVPPPLPPGPPPHGQTHQ